MAFTENFGDFINPDTPGYVVATVGSDSLPGIFLNEYDPANLGGLVIEGSDPVIVCEESKVDDLSIIHGSALTINSDSYSVTEKRPDSLGMVVLVLRA